MSLRKLCSSDICSEIQNLRQYLLFGAFEFSGSQVVYLFSKTIHFTWVGEWGSRVYSISQGGLKLTM